MCKRKKNMCVLNIDRFLFCTERVIWFCTKTQSFNSPVHGAGIFYSLHCDNLSEMKCFLLPFSCIIFVALHIFFDTHKHWFVHLVCFFFELFGEDLQLSINSSYNTYSNTIDQWTKERDCEGKLIFFTSSRWTKSM